MTQAKDHFLLVGGGGREASFAAKLAGGSTVSAFLTHRNPGILACVGATGGAYHIGSVRDPEAVTRFALETGADYAFVSADDPLAHGVVDALLAAGVKTVGATQAASRIEWDKVYAMNLMRDVAPEFTPMFTIIDPAENAQAISAKLEMFADRGLEVVVKPQGLTGGKGVKVMPEHLRDYQDCADYAKELLATRPSEQVLFVEKLLGIEFTVMGLTDGANLVSAPGSYDYPFRYENDTGPGTGGMGCFTAAEGRLPFLSEADMNDCETVMRRVLERMAQTGNRFNGVLNSGFFKTAQGIRFMEFNSRFGDPEALNVLTVLATPFADMLRAMHSGELSSDSVSFLPQASVVKYLVAAEYPQASPSTMEFTLDRAALERAGVDIFFGACEHIEGNRYQTLGSSRILALGATADDIPQASDLVNKAIEQHLTGELEYRADIGSKEDLERLMARASRLG